MAGQSAAPQGRQTPPRLKVELGRLLEAAGLTNVAAAEAIGTHRATIRDWRRRGIPDESDKVRRAAKALGVTEAELRAAADSPVPLASVTALPSHRGDVTGGAQSDEEWPTASLRRAFHEGIVKQLHNETGLTPEVIAALRPTAIALGVWSE